MFFSTSKYSISIRNVAEILLRIAKIGEKGESLQAGHP
jgi:hypothetical protein